MAFGRDAETGGLNWWTERLNKGEVTLASFALQVALGAQNQDIIALRNKIESANLFSSSLDTPKENSAYSGANAELFGRNFLEAYGSFMATPTDINNVLQVLAP
jgi:hypothetical protein